MQPEKVDECLINYRKYVARCSFLEHEIHELKSLAEKLRSTAVEDAISSTQTISDMPRGTAVSNPVEKIVIKYADGYVPDYIRDIENEIIDKEREYREKMPTIVFVEAWLKVLNRRERFVIESKVIDGMFWRELVDEYKNEFGEEYSRQGLKKVRDRAIEKIYNVAQ